MVWIKTEVVLAFLGLNPGQRKKKTKEKEKRRGEIKGGERHRRKEKKPIFNITFLCFPSAWKTY